MAVWIERKVNPVFSFPSSLFFPQHFFLHSTLAGLNKLYVKIMQKAFKKLYRQSSPNCLSLFGNVEVVFCNSSMDGCRCLSECFGANKEEEGHGC
jgi:hypothetical protein